MQHIKGKFDFETDGLLYTSKTNIQIVVVCNIHSVINNVVKKIIPISNNRLTIRT